MGGMGGRTGTMARVIANPAISLMRLGWAALLKIGALASKAKMRASGKINAAIQASSCALVIEITAYPIMFGIDP